MQQSAILMCLSYGMHNCEDLPPGMAKQTVTNYQSKFRLQTQALLAFFKCLDIVQVIVVSCRLKEICSWRVSELFPAVSLSIKQPETLFIFLVKPS